MKKRIKTYLTPNEKWFQLRGILIGISIGLLIGIIFCVVLL